MYMVLGDFVYTTFLVFVVLFVLFFACAPDGRDVTFENTRRGHYRSDICSVSLVPSQCVLQSPITYIFYLWWRGVPYSQKIRVKL